MRVAKGELSRALVRYCIGLLTVTGLWAMALKTVKPEVDLSDVLTFIGAAFGGELLLLLLTRVFAKEREGHGSERDFEESDQP